MVFWGINMWYHRWHRHRVGRIFCSPRSASGGAESGSHDFIVMVVTIRYSSPMEAREILRSARAAAGMTQLEVASRAGVTQSVISAYESGRREPSLPMLQRLVEATGHKLDVSFRRVADAPRNLPDTPAGRQLRRHRRRILQLASERGADHIRVFGSVARGDDDDSSDVDLLVDLADDVGLVGLAGLERELSELLEADVDVVPASLLKPAVRELAEAEAIAL